MHKIPYFLTISFIVSFVIGMILGIFEVPDAFFYVVLGKYLTTGQIIPVRPFNENIPQTLFAPLYGLIATFIDTLPDGISMTVLSGGQLFLLCVSGYLLYRVLLTILPSLWAKASIVVFLLLPFNLIYATVFMSETVTSFLVSVYIFILWRVLQKNSRVPASMLVFISCILTLTRYAFQPFVLISLIIWLRGMRKPMSRHIPGILGILLLCIWMIINFRLYGTFTLSSFLGRHLYNNVVTSGKLIPPQNSSQFKEFRSRLPDEKTLFSPWWEVQVYWAPLFRSGLITEPEVDQLFLNISLAAIAAHPLAYTANIIRLAGETFITPPYHDGVLEYVTTNSASCRFSWSTHLCQPLLHTSHTNAVWKFWINFNKAMYPWGIGIIMIPAFIGFIYAAIHGPLFFRLLTILFFIQHMLQSASEWLEGRFLLPLYPFIAIFICIGLNQIIKIIRNKYPPNAHHALA